jgi:hypothetical protein
LDELKSIQQLEAEFNKENMYRTKILTKTFRVTCVGFAIILISTVIKAYANRIALGYTDSAGFMELVSKSGLTSPLRSVYFSSSTRLTALYQESSEKICGMIPEAYEGTRSVFRGHPYLVSVFGSAVSWITNFKPNVTAALLLTGSSLMGLVSIFIFLLKNRMSYFTTGLFVFTIGCYPVFTQSLLGQPYFDRLMFGPGVTVFLLIWWTKYRSFKPWRWICVLTIVLALISERGAALAGLISIGYLFILHGRKVFTQRELRYVLIVGIASLVYIYIWSKVWQNSTQYNQISLFGWWHRLEIVFSGPNTSDTKLFFLVSASLLVLALFSGRGFALVALSIFPNLVMTVGGAELIGFLTHYHQVYLPVLVAASTIGITNLSKLIRRINNQQKSKAAESLFIVLFSVISFNFCFAQVAPNYGVSVLNDARSLWLPFTTNHDVTANQIRSQQSEITNFTAQLKLLPVSAQESMYPPLLLSGVSLVEYWPFGVGSAQVVIAPYVNGLPNVLPHADPQGSTDELQRCVQIEFDKNYELKKIFDGDVRVYVKK